MKTWYVEFGPVIHSGLGGGAMNPVVVERYCYLEAKNYKEASERALLVGQAERTEVKAVWESSKEEAESLAAEATDGADELGAIVEANS